MVYGIDNEASLQKLPDKSQISQEKEWILQLEIEKRERKTLKIFQKLVKQISQILQYYQSRKSQRSIGNVYKETDQELGWKY